MPRYIVLEQNKIKRLKREAQQFQDDIVCAVGTDFMQNIAEAENRMIFDILKGLENEPTADVAPKSEAIKEYLAKVLEKKDIAWHFAPPHEVVSVSVLEHYSKEFTEGKNDV